MTNSCTGNIPFEFDEAEPEVTIEFDAQPHEPTTRDDPRCDASIDITEVVRVDNGIELTIDGLADSIKRHFEQCVWDYLKERDEEVS